MLPNLKCQFTCGHNDQRCWALSCLWAGVCFGMSNAIEDEGECPAAKGPWVCLPGNKHGHGLEKCVLSRLFIVRKKGGG